VFTGLDKFEQDMQTNPLLLKSVFPAYEPLHNEKKHQTKPDAQDQLKHAKEFIFSMFAKANGNSSRIIKPFFICSLLKKQVAEVFKFIKDLTRGTNLTNQLKRHGFI